MSKSETTVMIEFATQDKADAFNADLKQSLTRIRNGIGSPFATVIAPGVSADVSTRSPISIAGASASLGISAWRSFTRTVVH